MPWNTLWTGLKDVLLTGTGLTLILSQVFSPRPSDVLLVAGLALTVPSAATHARDVLSGPTGVHSSGSSPPEQPSASPPSSSEVGTGE